MATGGGSGPDGEIRRTMMTPSSTRQQQSRQQQQMYQNSSNTEEGWQPAVTMTPMPMPSIDGIGALPAGIVSPPVASGRMYLTDGDQVSRASSDGQSLGQSASMMHDNRPNLKKEPSDNSSIMVSPTGINNSINNSVIITNPPPYGGSDYKYNNNINNSMHNRNSHHTPPRITETNALMDSGGPDYVMERQSHQQQLQSSSGHQHQQQRHSDQQVGERPDPHHNMNNNFPGYLGNNSNHNTTSRVMDLRPPPRPGKPRIPTTSAVEPFLPSSRLGRRCLTTEKPHRQPDKVVGDMTNTAGNNDDDHNDDGGGVNGTRAATTIRIVCPGCETIVRIPRNVIVMECPNCGLTCPTVTCQQFQQQQQEQYIGDNRGNPPSRGGGGGGSGGIDPPEMLETSYVGATESCGEASI